jgi:hypothetical protein
MDLSHFSINIKSNNFKDICNRFLQALDRYQSRLKELKLYNQSSENLYQEIVRDCKDLSSTGKCDFEYLRSRIVAILIHSHHFEDRYEDIHALRYLFRYIDRAKAQFEEERSKAMRGLICVDLRTGLAYISK